MKAILLSLLLIPTAAADGPDMVIVPNAALQQLIDRNNAAVTEIERLRNIVRF